MSSDESLVSLFKSIGLTQAKAAEAAKSPKNAATLKDLIQRHELVGKLDEKQAGLIAALSVHVAKSDGLDNHGRTYLVDQIVHGRLKSTDQVAGMRVCPFSFR